MKQVLLFLTLLIATGSTARAQSPADVDSTLFVYYQWCSNNRFNPATFAKADTLFRLSGEKQDIRMQCVALTFKADYYYFNNNLDSLKAWMPVVQNFARANNQPKYYYFIWSRLILFYTKHMQYTLAQYELERYLAQARKDDYKPATADAYIQLGHIYRTKGLNRISAEHYRQAIDLIEQNKLDGFNLSNYYGALASMLIGTNEFEQAAEAIEKGKACISIRDHIWALKLNESNLYIKTGELRKAKTLLDEIQRDGSKFVPQTQLLEYLQRYYTANKQYAKALELLNALQDLYQKQGLNPSYYATLFNDRASIYAASGNYEAAFENLEKYVSAYRQKVSEENQSSLQEFSTLLDVNRLDQEKAQLKSQAQAERLRRTRLISIGLALILALAGVFIAIQIRTNRKLKRAMLAAEESNRMKSLFIRSVTHEINTPLNAIVGFSELATTTSADSQEREEYIAIIRENSSQLQKLVNDVLYISDLESCNEPPITVQTDVNACCRHCIDQVNKICPEGIRLEFLPARENCSMVTSQLFLTKLINELLVNAIQFTRQGTVTLTYELTGDGRNILFAVADTGCGIPPAESRRIFDRFVKLDTFSTGLGLGLSVCALIAKALGGGIELDTTYSPGARFTVSLPTNEELSVS